MKSYTPPSVIDNKCTHAGRVAALSVWVFNFKQMRIIKSKKELAEFFRDTLLPYYEQHYREDLTLGDACGLEINNGLCSCALYEFNVFIYEIMAGMAHDCGFLFTEIMEEGCTAKESLLPRIEWMKQFIIENK